MNTVNYKQDEKVEGVSGIKRDGQGRTEDKGKWAGVRNAKLGSDK